MKQPARSFAPPPPITTDVEEVAVQERIRDPFPQATAEEAASSEAITDEVFLYIYRDGYEEIVEELKNSNNLPETVGNMSGNLVSTEVVMLEEDGGSFPQDMFIQAAVETVEQFTDIVDNEEIMEFRNDGEAQAFMSEALTYAIGAGIDSDYEGVTEDSMISVAENILRGDMDMEISPIDATRVIEEVV